jgi:tRNA1(Val) A37 N6-methylase TrmN6
MIKQPITVFVGGPFSAAMKITSDGMEFDARLRSSFETVHRHIREIGLRLLSSHITDSFGAKFEESELVLRDNTWVKECNIYLALLPLDSQGFPYRSDGTFMEAGIAIASGKRVVLVMEGPDHPSQSYYVRNTDAVPTVKIIEWNEFMADPVSILKEEVERIADAPATGVQREHTTDPDDVIARLSLQSDVEEVIVNGTLFRVLPGVLSPKLSHAPDYLMANWSIKKGARVLDLGCGCGVLGISALVQGAGSLVALDKNPTAVENTLINIKEHGLEKVATARLSDIYGSLEPHERFDIILLSPPYWDRPAITHLANACFDQDYQFLTGAIRGIRNHLDKEGRVFVIFSNQGNVTKLVRDIQESGLLINQLIVHSPSIAGGHSRIFFELSLDSEQEGT